MVLLCFQRHALSLQSLQSTEKTLSIANLVEQLNKTMQPLALTTPTRNDVYKILQKGDWAGILDYDKIR